MPDSATTGRTPDRPDRYVLELQQIDRTQAGIVGGKGANLAELARIAGVRVPPGFCITTEAFRRVISKAPALDAQLEQLARLQAEDR